MATLKKYNLSGQEVGNIEIADTLAKAEANSQMIKDYIVALRANARQWSANTKGRSEVNHSTKKPHPQKGTGRARQGRLSSPQYKGGGRVHAPKPKFDQHVRTNKKEKRAAIRALIGDKIRANKLFIIESSEIEAPKTKKMSEFLNKYGIAGRTLFLGENSFLQIEELQGMRIQMPSDKHDNFIKSIRNIPRTQFSLATNINGYDVICAQNIIATEAALSELTEWLS